MSDQDWRIYIMPTDPNQGVVRTGQYPIKPTLEETDNALWITTEDDDDPVLVVSLYGCMSVLVARREHIEEIEKAEREAADAARLREAGAMGAGDEPTP